MLRVLVISILSLLLLLGCNREEQPKPETPEKIETEISQPAPATSEETAPSVDKAQQKAEQAAQASEQARSRLQNLRQEAVLLAEEAESVTRKVTRVTQQVEDINQRLDRVAEEIETVMTDAEAAMNQITRARKILLQSTSELACETGQPNGAESEQMETAEEQATD